MKKIEKFYNTTVGDAFRSSIHCLRVSIISFLVFSIFIVINLINNYGNDCWTEFLCFGYLSFQRKPHYLVVVYIICLITFLTFLYLYVQSIIVEYFYSSGQQNIDEKKIYTTFSLQSPTFKVFSEEDKLNNLNFFIDNYDKFNDCLKREEDLGVKDLIINCIVFSVNILLIVLNCGCSGILYYVFGSIALNSYFIVNIVFIH